jgi:predicted naringenin-chalcone synthase
MWGNVIGRGPAIMALYRRSGVKTRHSILVNDSTNGHRAKQTFYHPAEHTTDCGPSTQVRMQRYEQEATDLATVAAGQALQSAGVSAETITHLVTVSCSGFASPGFDLGLVDTLGLRRNVVRTHVGFMGCHAAFNAWRVAHAFAGSDSEARVLVCCVELCSLHQQYSADAEQIVANSLFADGAAALIADSTNSTDDSDWRLIEQQSYVVPQTADLMTWRIGDHGFQMTLSPRIPETIQTNLKPWLQQWLAPHGLSVEDIRSWAIHPGGPRILNACEAALELPPEALAVSREILERYGNMSSPTIMFILNRLREKSALRPCVSLAFGPGITLEAALWD